MELTRKHRNLTSVSYNTRVQLWDTNRANVWIHFSYGGSYEPCKKQYNNLITIQVGKEYNSNKLGKNNHRYTQRLLHRILLRHKEHASLAIIHGGNETLRQWMILTWKVRKNWYPPLWNYYTWCPRNRDRIFMDKKSELKKSGWKRRSTWILTIESESQQMMLCNVSQSKVRAEKQALKER